MADPWAENLASPSGSVLQDIYKTQAAGQKNQLIQEEIQGRNMLAKLYQQPGALDPQTGTLKPQALNMLAQAGFPDVAMGYMQDVAKLRQTQQATALAGQKVADANREFAIDTMAGPAHEEYERLYKGAGPDAAQRAAQAVYSQGLDTVKASGRLTPEEIQKLSPEYNHQRATYNLFGSKELQRQREKSVSESRQEENVQSEIAHRKAQEEAEKRKEAGGWEPRVDTDGTNYSYNKNTGEAKTLDHSEPYKIKGGAGKVGAAGTMGALQAENMRQFIKEFKENPANEGREPSALDRANFLQASRAAPRSGPAMVMQKWAQENPHATAEQAQFKVAEIAAQMSATKQFMGAGQRSDTIRRFSVADSHLEVLNEAAQALAQHNAPALNALQNVIAKQFGYAGPVAFDAVKKLVSPEVTLAVIGGKGTGEERQQLQRDFDGANTEEQLAEVTKRVKQLIGGQLDGYRREFKAETKLGDDAFDLLLSDAAKADMPAPGGAYGGARGGSTAGGSAPPVPAATPRGDPSGGIPTVTKEQYDKLPGGGTPYRMPGQTTIYYKP